MNKTVSTSVIASNDMNVAALNASSLESTARKKIAKLIVQTSNWKNKAALIISANSSAKLL